MVQAMTRARATLPRGERWGPAAGGAGMAGDRVGPLPEPVRLGAAPVTPEDIERVALHRARVDVGPVVRRRMRAARGVIERALSEGRTVYGLNTGLGAARDQSVPADLLEAYQRQIVMTHAGAVGPPLAEHDARAVLAARAAGLARGGSGATLPVLETLVAFLNSGLTPVIPETGSVGASDLGHLAAVALVAIGRGRATIGGRVLPAAQALEFAGIPPLHLEPKDALALISANSVSIGIGALVARRAGRVARMADLSGALAMEALDANLSPFAPVVQEAKAFPGQADAAENVRNLLAGSRLERPGVAASRQDALSFRTIPQVHGALREQMAAAHRAVAVELAGRGDNPLVLADTDETISNGNFQPLVLALAFEGLRVAIAHVAMLSERRMAKLIQRAWVDGGRASRLAVDAPEGDARYRFPGLMSYSAASLVAELKHIAAPITLGVPPLDFDVEDHSTLANAAVMITRTALDKLETVLSIEALLAVHEIGQRDLGGELGRGTARALAAVQGLADTMLDPDPLAADLVGRLHDVIAQLLVEEDRPLRP
jgi:histidine ammonia-lyase